MKFRDRNGDADITWGDHERDCKTCRGVDLAKPVTFVKACAMGSQLLMEELKKRQAPLVQRKAKAVEEWAKSTGTFREFDGKTKLPPKYVGE